MQSHGFVEGTIDLGFTFEGVASDFIFIFLFLNFFWRPSLSLCRRRCGRVDVDSPKQNPLEYESGHRLLRLGIGEFRTTTPKRCFTCFVLASY